MNKGFWETIDTPCYVMAPMADVTDRAFRRMFAKYGKPDVTWTEFVSADGLFLRPIEPGVGDQPHNEFEQIALNHGIGVDHPLLKDLMYTDAERPIVAQFFSRDPEHMHRAAALARDLGFDGVDINMGCPADVICKQGAGAAMIKDPVHAQKIIRATIDGAGGLPVSVKTRIGYTSDILDEWLSALLDTQLSAVIIHARTRKQMSKVPADWSTITRAVHMRNTRNSDTLILGNGDVETMNQARQRVNETGCDGVMIGRGLFGNPWVFTDITPTVSQRLQALLEHTQLFIELLGDTKNFNIMKKHYKAYVNGFDGAKELRTALMHAHTYDEIDQLVRTFLNE